MVESTTQCIVPKGLHETASLQGIVHYQRRLSSQDGGYDFHLAGSSR